MQAKINKIHYPHNAVTVNFDCFVLVYRAWILEDTFRDALYFQRWSLRFVKKKKTSYLTPMEYHGRIT